MQSSLRSDIWQTSSLIVLTRKELVGGGRSVPSAPLVPMPMQKCDLWTLSEVTLHLHIEWGHVRARMQCHRHQTSMEGGSICMTRRACSHSPNYLHACSKWWFPKSGIIMSMTRLVAALCDCTRVVVITTSCQNDIWHGLIILDVHSVVNIWSSNVLQALWSIEICAVKWCR